MLQYNRNQEKERDTMKVLAIDTSNQTLALALSQDQNIIEDYVENVQQNHSMTLMTAIDNLLKKNNWHPKELERIIVAQGPGSYTGLRIGVTTAKTLAWTLGIDLVGVSSLASLAANATEFKGMIVPLFDARRRNVYTGMYQWQNDQLVTIKEDRHIELTTWLEELHKVEGPLLFVGEDVEGFATEIAASFGESAINREAVINKVSGSSLVRLGAQIDAVVEQENFIPKYLKLVEAEEKWLVNNPAQEQTYVEKI